MTMKKLLILGGIAASMFAPESASATTYRIGGPDCYVQIDVTDLNIVVCGGEPPCWGMNPEGSTGAGVNCPPIT